MNSEMLNQVRASIQQLQRLEQMLIQGMQRTELQGVSAREVVEQGQTGTYQWKVSQSQPRLLAKLLLVAEDTEGADNVPPPVQSRELIQEPDEPVTDFLRRVLQVIEEAEHTHVGDISLSRKHFPPTLSAVKVEPEGDTDEKKE